MEFAILGPLEVRHDGSAVALGGAKPRALLAALLAHAGRPVAAEKLAMALWGEDAPATSARALQPHVSRLRRALGAADVIETTPAGYRLRLEPGALDADEFERLLADGRRALADGEPERAGVLLRSALALWRGPALADLAYDAATQAEIARLEELRVVAHEACADADLAAGRSDRAIAQLRRLVTEHPLRERLHGRLMVALYRDGRQADALEVYRRCRDALVEQLGIEPGPELRALHQAVLAHEPDLDAIVTAPPPPAARVRLPAPASPLLGRDAELVALGSQIGHREVRMLTLTGPAGVGKTRLAIELARAVAPRFRDGAVFVPLAPVGGVEHVGAAIARAVGAEPGAGEGSANGLGRLLGDGERLLVLDNLEHLLGAAPLIAELLAVAPELTVLATSREPLRIRAERVAVVEPLGLEPSPGGARAPAVVLFAALAAARDPAFELDEDAASAAEEICRRLDGLPLAIELAAGRLGVRTAGDVAEELRGGLRALGTAPRDAEARHRTLADAVEWSVRLLSAEERRTFTELAVFAGGCSPEDAVAVTGTTVEVLDALVTKHLMRREGPRLGMLVTIRALAAERLEASPDAVALRRVHAEHVLAFAERAGPEYERASDPERLAAIDAELENVRAALDWGTAHDPVLALRLGSALSKFWTARGLRREAARRLQAALDAAGEGAPDTVRARALEALAFALGEAATYGQAEAAAWESLAIRERLGDTGGRARSHYVTSSLLLHRHLVAEAHEHAAAAARLAAEAGDATMRASALATVASTAPTLAEALAAGEQAAAALAEGGGGLRDIAALRTNLAYAALAHHAPAEARRLCAEAMEVAMLHAEPLAIAYVHGNDGLAALLLGDPEHAAGAFSAELRLVSGLGEDAGMDGLLYEAVHGLAGVAAARGADRLAATLCGAADRLTAEHHDPVIAAQLERDVFGPARRRLGAPGWVAAHRAGAALGRDRALEAALAAGLINPPAGAAPAPTTARQDGAGRAASCP